MLKIDFLIDLSSSLLEYTWFFCYFIKASPEHDAGHLAHIASALLNNDS